MLWRWQWAPRRNGSLPGRGGPLLNIRRAWGLPHQSHANPTRSHANPTQSYANPTPAPPNPTPIPPNPVPIPPCFCVEALHETPLFRIRSQTQSRPIPSPIPLKNQEALRDSTTLAFHFDFIRILMKRQGSPHASTLALLCSWPATRKPLN